MVLPEEAGIGARPAGACELCVGREAVGAGDLADQLRCGQRPTAALLKQLWRVALDERGELCLEFADPAGARGDLAHELAGDPHACGLLGAREAAGDRPEPLVGVQRAGRDLQLGPEVVQMPAQPLLVSWCAAAIRSSRWSTSRRMSSAAPSRCAPGRVSIPSLSAARATLNASIESDLPRSREARLAPAMCFGATRTIRSPRAIRNRSSAPDTCRQSSIAHTRSGSSARAQRSSLPKLPSRADTVSSARAAAVSASTAPQVCVRLCVSVPITIIQAVPSIDQLTKRTPADKSHSGLVPSSYQVTPVVLGRRRATRHPVGQTTGRQKVNESARRQPENQPQRAGRHRPTRTLSVRKSSRCGSGPGSLPVGDESLVGELGVFAELALVVASLGGAEAGRVGVAVAFA